MSNKNLLVILLIVITAIYYLPIINLPVGIIDESFELVGAERIFRGQIPYKDFSSEYPPGQYYILSTLFKVFGVSVITERVYDLLIKSLLSLCIFLIIRFLSSSTYALVGWLMSLIWILSSPYPAYSVYPSILFIYIGVYCLLMHFQDKKNYYVVLSAPLVVIAILFRHDLGGFTAVVITTILLLRRLVRVQSWTPLVLFIASGIIAALPIIIYFVIYSDVRAMLNDLVFIPMAYLQHQTLPYPALSRWNLPFYIFPAVIVTGAIVAIILIMHKRDDAKAYALMLISIIGIFCFDRIRMRPDRPHLLPVALTGILLAPILLYVLSRELSLSKWKKKIVYILFVVIFGITLSRPVEIMAMILSRTNSVIKSINPDIERAKYQYVFEDIKNVVSFIKRNTSKDDYIYVGVKNHDKFHFNDILIYFLADRNYASRYHALNPGVQTTFKVQEEMVNEFKKKSVRLIVLGYRTWGDEPNLSSIDTKVDFLDNYISSNYELKATYGSYEIWIRKIG